jgi:sugar phosphate isomerase/epimerase
MKYTFGLRGHDIADNFDDMCRVAKNSGIKKLQFALAKTVNDVNFDTIGYDSELSFKIKKQLDDYDLHVSVLGCYINPIATDKKQLNTQLTRFKNFLYYAKDFSADVIGTETGLLDTLEKTHSEENYLNFVENMRPIVKEAEKLGVTVGIEPVYSNTIFSPQRMRRLLDDINSESLGVILDVSNMTYPQTRYMQCDIINDSFDLFGDKIKAIHLKDFTFDDEGKKSFAVAGTGELMTELIFDRLSQLSHTPEIILDGTKLVLYNDSLVSLENILD